MRSNSVEMGKDELYIKIGKHKERDIRYRAKY